MRVVTWNVHRCIGIDGAYRPERILEVLRALNADVIALQEIDSSLYATDDTNQLDFLADGLGFNAVMGPTLHRDYGAYGNAILTHHEIRSFEEYDLSYRRFEPRGAIAVEIGVGMDSVRVINTHLGLKYWERSFQIDRLLSDLVWTGPQRVIVAGDFNEWCPWTGNNLRLERAFASRGKRLRTFPAQWPRFALDRIFLSSAVDDLRLEVALSQLTRVASDHLPVVAEFAFK